MPLRSTIASAALLACLLTASAPAWAQPRDPVAGEALFREGRRLLKAGDLPAACAKLEESQRLDPAAGTLANLADCEERLGRTASAWEHWRRVAEGLPATDSRRTTALARSAALEAQLPRLTIELDPELAQAVPAGLLIQRDGVALGAASLGLALPLDPGPHTVVVTAPDRLPQTFKLVVAAAEQSRLVVNLGPRRLPASAPVVQPSGVAPLELQSGPVAPPARGRRLAGYALLGTGAAAVGAGIFFGLKALQAREDAQKGCAMTTPGGPPPVCWAQARDALSRDTTYARLADAAFASGAIATLAGGYLWFSARETGRTHGTIAAHATGAEVQIVGRF